MISLSIGDQSPFDKHLGYRPSGRCDQRPYHQCTGTDPEAGNQIAAFHDVVKQCPPLSVAYTAGFNQFDRFVSIGPSLALIFGRVRRRCRRPCAAERHASPDEPAISPREHAIGVTRASLISHPSDSLSAGAQQILPLLLEDISSLNCHDVRLRLQLPKCHVVATKSVHSSPGRTTRMFPENKA